MSHSLIVKAITFFFRELNKKGVRYAVLRKAELIPDNIGNDIDILINKHEKPAVLKIINDCADKLGFKVYERQGVGGLYAVLYGFFDGKLSFFRLDFTNPVKNPDELLRKRIKNEKGVYYLPEGVYKKEIKSRFNNFLTYPWRFLFPPGKFVVIVGPDGVGKSTAAELAAQVLEAFHIPVKHLHLGFRPRILPTKRSIVSLGKQKEPIPGEESKVPGLIRFFYHILDYFFGFWFIIRPALIRGQTVIGERYYYSFLVDPRPQKRYGVPRWLLELVCFFMPKPDMVILLSAGPEIIYKRRQEHSMEEIADQIMKYRAIGMGAKKFLEVNTDKSPADVAMEISSQLAPKKYKLAVVASHPIQYLSPLWAEIAKQPEIDLMVYYCSDWGVNKPQFDPRFFGVPYKWDIPLLEGYNFKFLRNYAPNPRPALGGLINPGIIWKLWKNKYDAVLIFGWMDITNWFAYLAAFLRGTPVLLRAVSSSYYDTHGKRSRLLLFFKKNILKNFFRFFVSSFLSIGKRNRDFYIEYGVPPEKIFNFPYAVWNDFFFSEMAKHAKWRPEIRKTLGIGDKAVVITFAARFVPRRHPEHAVLAYEKLKDIPNLALLMVGDGEMMKGLQEIVKEKNLKNVFFAGFKNQRELVEMYAASDIFIRADETIESGDWGATVNEAMACGLPVITTDAAASNVDLIRRGENGYVYDFGDIEALANLIRILVQDKKLLASMKKKSLEIIKKQNYKEDIKGFLKALEFVCGESSFKKVDFF